MKNRKPELRLIETDEFPFEFLSTLAERESWRKEIHRPVYHVHKWWAKRLGSVFRGILLGGVLPGKADLRREFYGRHSFAEQVIFDPFMGSGTTVGEAHKLGFTALGQDINPVAVEAVETALGPLDRRKLTAAFEDLAVGVGAKIRDLYRSTDSKTRPCDVLYNFWVMQVGCVACDKPVDLFPSYVIARNAYPDRKPEVQVVCPACGDIFPRVNGDDDVDCPKCGHNFDMTAGPANGAKATCPHCASRFTIIDAIAPRECRPDYRLYGKLVLTSDGRKEYLPVTSHDLAAFRKSSELLKAEVEDGRLPLPELGLEYGHNTRQAMSYGFTSWRDFFNDRQLLALGWLRNAIGPIADVPTRRALMTLFSGVLEFNNLFASYKGEGTGAVRHMFSHHILKPERLPIEANVWGTSKSSGAFSTLFRSRLLRAIDYRESPTELNGKTGAGRVCAKPFSGTVEAKWPRNTPFVPGGIYLSCGDSANANLPDQSVDFVVTDPPFFDNVHYSELADFFFAWQQLDKSTGAGEPASTRSPSEVQDADPELFARKLRRVFGECRRVLKDDGLLVFSYHHSREEGWRSLFEAIVGAGFKVINSQPVKAEMSVSTPKSQAKEPIQLDIVLVCRKDSVAHFGEPKCVDDAIEAAKAKLARLAEAGFVLSRNDRKVVLYGQLLTAISDAKELFSIEDRLKEELNVTRGDKPHSQQRPAQRLLFEELT